MRELQTKFPKGKVIRERYVIEDLLGKGGFGAVYRVRDRRVKGNVFALKEVNNPNRHQRESFFFEGELLRRLDHPFLPRVYRVFEENKNDRICMLMDYIEGPNLERLRLQQPEKRFSLSQVGQMMDPIIDAVSYLHQQDPPIIHRDVKPSNIIIPTSGEGAVLVDFGIAKEYEEDSTTTAIRHCSPGYGAPEQYVSGTSKQTDIYGLGATIYTLLTGMVPIDALYRITRLSVKRADPLQLASDLSPDIPVPLAEVLQRALAVNSNDRFDSVEEFWQAFKAFAPGPSTDPVMPVRTHVPETAEHEQIQIPAFSDDAASVNAISAADGSHMSLPLHAQEVPLSLSGNREISSRSLFYGSVALFLFVVIIAGSLGAATMFARAQDNMDASSQASMNRTATALAHAESTQSALQNPDGSMNHTATRHVMHTPPAMVQKPIPTLEPTVTSQYPTLLNRYSGPIYDVPVALHSSVALSNIIQTQDHVYGYVAFGPGLIGDGNFSGTVTTDDHIMFLVPSSSGLLPLFFEGQIQANGSIAGTYCSYSNGHCDYQGGGYGNWDVVP